MMLYENLLLEEIDQLRVLWEENSRFHHDCSSFFNDQEWLKNNGCNRIEVSTTYGNEAAIAFYKKLSIYPKSVRMELK